MKILRFFIVLIGLTNVYYTQAADKRVMVVSVNAPADDAIIRRFMDEVNAIEGVEAIHILLADMKMMTDFSAYDAALITENGGSSDMAAFSNYGWQIPAVHLKAYSLHKSDYPLFNQVSDVNWCTSPKSADLLAGITDLVVKDNLDILADYPIGGIVQWTTGYNTTESLGPGVGEAHVQAFNLNDAVNCNAAIVANASPLASDKYFVDESYPVRDFLWKIEENSYTKRMVCWGVHQGFLEYATDDFYKILVNSVKWVLKIQDTPRLKSLMVDHGTLFPTFNPSVFAYRLAVDTTVDSVLIAAQSYDGTDIITGTGCFNAIPGVATILVTSDNAKTATYTIDISHHTEVPELSLLAVSGNTLIPSFDPDTTEYTIKVDTTLASVFIHAASWDTNAVITGTGEFSSIPGTAMITIVSPYGIENHYYVHFVFKSSATLSSLSLTDGHLLPSFHPDILHYRFSVTGKPDSILIAATTNNPGATVRDTGYFSSIPGNAVISVISEDSVIREYTVKVFYGESNACLASLSASAGMLEPAFDPEILNYDLVVPNEINEVFITAVAEEENAQVTGDGLIGHFPRTCSIVVVAADKTTLEYHITIYKSNDIMVVSANLPTDDAIIQKFMDKMNAIEGISATHVSLENFKAMTDFSAYDAVLITENGGSSDMAVFSSMGWPIPAVHLKAYSLYKGDYPLFTQVPGVNWYTTNKSTDLLPGIDWLFVKNNRDIFTGYQVGDSIQWTTGYNTTLSIGAGEAHIQAFDLKNSAYTQSSVASSSAPLASDKHLVDNDLPVKDFLWKIEENGYTKRMVCWGIHHDFLEYATDDFYKILVNSMKWVLHMKEQTGLLSLTVDNGNLIPEFDPNVFNYGLTVEPDIDSVLITALPYNEADTVIGTGYFSKIPGKATIMVVTANDEIVTYQITLTYKTAIKNIPDMGMQTRLFPVPFDEQLTVSTLPEAGIIISNLLGQAMYHGISNGEGELILNTTGFERGMYIVSVLKDGYFVNLKGIKQ